MGKGNRNRVDRDESVLTQKSAKSKKRRARRPLPKLLVPVICIVLVVAAVVGITVYNLNRNGDFKRMNILVKSKTGHYNIDQQMATYMVWNSVYDQAANLWDTYENYNSGYAAMITGVNSKFEYCWNQAQYAVNYQLNTYITDYFSSVLTSYVAVCDEGEKNMNIKLTADEKDVAVENALSSMRSKAYSYYEYLQSAGISDISPAYVYYNSYPYFGQYWNTALGSDIKQKDLEKVAVLQAMADKVLSRKQSEYWDADSASVLKEVSENPESYYTADYLTYATESAALAGILEGVSTEKDFRAAIADQYVEDHYIALYNKYVTEKAAEVNNLLAAVKEKTSADELNTALTEQGMTATDYTSESTLDDDVKAWLFDDERKQFDATSLTSEDGKTVTVAVISAISEDGKTVTAALKAVTYETISDSELTTLKNTVRSRLDLAEEGTTDLIQTADDQATDLLDKLNAEGADRAALMTAVGATNESAINAETETVPATVRSKVFDDTVNAGDAVKAGSGSTVYVIVINAKNVPEAAEGEEETPAATADISYVTFNVPMVDVINGLYTDIGSELPSVKTASFLKPAATKAAELLEKLNAAEDPAAFFANNGGVAATGVTAEDKKSVPDEVYEAAKNAAAGQKLTVDVTDSTAKYLVYVSAVADDGISLSYLQVSTYEEGSFQEWLFKNVDPAAMTGSPAEGTTFKKETTKDEKTTYDVYLVTKSLYRDEEETVRGGYMAFATEEEANDALEKLKGKTGVELLEALDALSQAGIGSAVASNALDSHDINASEVKKWLFVTSHEANDVAVVHQPAEGSVTEAWYVVAFLAKLPAWENSARSNYASARSGEWIDALVKDGGYAVSESALKKIKDHEPETVEETTGEETTAETPVETTAETSTEAVTEATTEVTTEVTTEGTTTEEVTA